VLIHPQVPGARWVEVVADSTAGETRDTVEAWRHDLVRAGAIHTIVRVPSGIDTLLADLREVTTTRIAS